MTYLLVTRGDQGGFDDTPREQMASMREAEQRAAAKAVGVTDVRFLDGYRDGWVEPTRELERDIARVIRQVRPQRMLIQSPERNYERLPASHSDHLATGEAAIRAIYPTARNPYAWPELVSDEGLEPWVVTEVFIAAHPGADHAVDVTATFDRKIAALREHRTPDRAHGRGPRADGPRLADPQRRRRRAARRSPGRDVPGDRARLSPPRPAGPTLSRGSGRSTARRRPR